MSAGRPLAISPSEVADRLAEVRRRIAAVAGGRPVRVVAVTKTWGIDAVRAAIAAGCDAVGENYAQEVVAKLQGRRTDPVLATVPLHFIGQLQRNKVRALAPLVDVFETVDRSSLAEEVARRLPGARVFVQVDATSEPGKGGCPVDDVAALVARCRDLGLVVDGVMAVGPTSGGPEAARPVFRRVRELADTLSLPERSMGMTDDLEVAVEEGSTQVRVGSALFGPRPPRD